MGKYYLSKRVREAREEGLRQGKELGRELGREIGREIGRKIAIPFGRMIGLRQGFYDGARAFVMVSISRGSTEDYILEMVQQCFRLSRGEAEKLYEECYW